MDVFTKKFTECHMVDKHRETIDEGINIFLKANPDVEIISVHPLNKKEPGLRTYSLEFLGVFKRKV